MLWRVVIQGANTPSFDTQTFLVWMFSPQHPLYPLQAFMQLLVFQSPGSDVCRQWDREVVEPSPKPFLCPPQGEGSTERVGTADPG